MSLKREKLYCFRILYIYLVTAFLLFTISCDDSNPLMPEDTSYNVTYEDSILFNSGRSPGIQIAYIDGSGIRTICDTIVGIASWSSNKRKIIIVGSSINDIQDEGIYIYNLANYELLRIIQQERKVQNAVYSPDMNYIAYSVIQDSLGYKLKLFNVSSGEISDLTDWKFQTMDDISWSPNSKDILIDDGYVINIDTKVMEVLFTFSGSNPSIIAPNWSPDGTKVVFSAHTQEGRTNLFIYNLITGETNVIYEIDEFQFVASWSKDGNKIIFDQRPYGNANSYICKINVDGTNFVRITDGTYFDFRPRWNK